MEQRMSSQPLIDRVQGVVPTRFKEADRQIDIRIRNEEASRASVEDVRRLMIPGISVWMISMHGTWSGGPAWAR